VAAEYPTPAPKAPAPDISPAAAAPPESTDIANPATIVVPATIFS